MTNVSDGWIGSAICLFEFVHFLTVTDVAWRHCFHTNYTQSYNPLWLIAHCPRSVLDQSWQIRIIVILSSQPMTQFVPITHLSGFSRVSGQSKMSPSSAHLSPSNVHLSPGNCKMSPERQNWWELVVKASELGANEAVLPPSRKERQI